MKSKIQNPPTNNPKSKFLFLLLINAFLLTAQNVLSQIPQFPPQPPVAGDPRRSLMVDDFYNVLNQSVNAGQGILDEDHSILAVDRDRNGTYENEVALVNYCKQNHITHISLYDIGKIFSSNAWAQISIWDQNSSSFQTVQWHLCRFLTYAHSNGIAEISLSGSSVAQLTPATEEFRFTSSEKNSPNFPADLLFIEDPINNGSPRSEKLKMLVRALGFGSCTSCADQFDAITYEEEFWNASASFVTDVRAELRDIYLLKEYYNFLHPNHQLYIEIYLSRLNDPTTGVLWGDFEIAKYLDG